MLKSIATARSDCTAKHENKASYNTDYIIPDLLVKIVKRSEDRLKKEIFIFMKNIVLKFGLLLGFSINFLSIIWKNDILTNCISY